MTEELKPCPNCNSRDVGGSACMAYCYNCGLTTAKKKTTQSAANYWNARPLEDALQSKLTAAEEEIERLRLALENIKSHQEISGGSAHKLSATWHIADKALSSNAKL